MSDEPGDAPPPARTAVFVHGNPETAVIWEPLFDALRSQGFGGELLPLSPPGFGAPLPPGFGATRSDYLAWLVDQLEGLVARIGEPVHLVGHDWGGGHVVGAALERPDLLRSWCTDIAGCFAPDYVWHDFAQVWQSPHAGEQAIEGMLAASVSDRARLFESVGLDHERARAVAAGFTAEMGRCILALYRSATQPAMAELGARLGELRRLPGLVIVPTEDTYTGGPARALASAERAGARVITLKGLGHWWMVQDPGAGALALRSFWNGLQTRTT